MIYDKPRQIAAGPSGVGKWRWTRQRQSADFQGPIEVRALDSCSECEHETAEEARACHRRWLFNQRILLTRLRVMPKHAPCVVCGRQTQLEAWVDNNEPEGIEERLQAWRLCNDHADREHVEQLFELRDRVAMERGETISIETERSTA